MGPKARQRPATESRTDQKRRSSRAARWPRSFAEYLGRAVREDHFPFRLSGPTGIRSDCERHRVLFERQLFLARVEKSATHPPPSIIEHSDGERWGSRLARLGLLLVHCLLRPFLASSSAVDSRPMRSLEVQSPSPTKSLVTAVIQRLSMDMSTAPSDNSPTNSSSEPSPQAADTKHMEMKCAPSPPPPQDEREEKTEQQEQDGDEFQQTLLRKSTGSVAIMTKQQEATFDHRRHTFSVMSADGRANMRRRSYDFTPQFGTFPPTSPHQSLPHSFKTHHPLQHVRMYDKSTTPSQMISECHQQGAPMVALVSPNPDTVWTRGKPVEIEWKVLDSKVEKLCIELLEDGQSATTLIAKEAPNTGLLTYHKVPWGMESGSKYFLRVSAADDSERYRTSSFFQISSAP
ncbi:Hypothetical protein PHPALM_14364 [Phytophthora palmivora]|uniref:Yeast cell wall synthesis Kre9/Knh1-like N-terminal domain-containing protein n=1 Tax=Phytophthora palmivora TaxID=4796 RepID=A0A2P4XUX7_9STRA|nr:Hypothetical protein PHPALM_14364 [Phytophthora palmivora]